MKEIEIQSIICDYLALKKYFFWRQNNISVFDGQNFRALPKYAMKGVADIILVKEKGKICFLEVKTDKGQLSENQVGFRQKCLEKGAEYYVVRSLDDVMALGL